MTTCERVRETLPGIAAGEPEDDGVRAHVDRCIDCRAQLDVLARDVDRVRAGLAGLSVPPALEVAVLRALGGPTGPARTSPREPRPVSWTVALGALAAVVAAAAVLPWWLGAHQPAAPGAEESLRQGAEEGGPTDVESPPTGMAVGEARAATEGYFSPPRTTAGERGMLLQGVSGRPGPGSPFSRFDGSGPEFFPPLVPPGTDVVHRWVYGDRVAIPGRRTWAMPDVPVHEVLLGRASGLDVRRTAETSQPGEALFHAGRATALDAVGRVEVVLASPDGSIKARVLARFERGFDGAAWVPDPLARALALHQFEIPGRAEAVHPVAASPNTTGSVAGHRARVRLHVDPLGYDQVVEAFVPATEAPTPGLSAHPIRFSGVIPTRIYTATAALRLGPDLSLVTDGQSETRGVSEDGSALLGPDGGHLAVSEDLADGTRRVLFLGSFDPAPSRTFALTHVTLPGPFPAEAQAVLATVWRRRTAAPAAAGASVSTVSADGSLTFLVRDAGAGERGRVRLVTREGAVSWHEVASRSSGVRFQVRAQASGKIQIDHFDERSGAEWRDQGVWDLSASAGRRDQEDALAELVRSLVGVKRNPHLTDPAGASRAVLLIEAEPATRWEHLRWALDAAQADDVRLRNVTLATPRGRIVVVLNLETAREWERLDPAVRAEAEVTLRPTGDLHVRPDFPAASRARLTLRIDSATPFDRVLQHLMLFLRPPVSAIRFGSPPPPPVR